MAINLSQVPGVPVIGQEQSPDVSMAGSFGRGMASMLPLGEQGYAGVAALAQNKPYQQERQELNQEIESDIQENPGSRLLGQAVGVIAPAIATGGASVPESLGETALQGAGIGSAFGLGNAIDTKAAGGSNLAALGDIGLGAGVGALGGLAGKAVGKGLESATEGLSKTDTVNRFMTMQKAKALGLTPISLGRLAQDQGVTPEVLINNYVKRLEEEPTFSKDFWKMTSNVNDKESFGLAEKDIAGRTLGMQRDAAGNYTKLGNIPGEFFPEGENTINDLLGAAVNYKGIDVETPTALKALASRLAEYKQNAELNFDTLSQFKTAIGKQLQADKPGAAQAYQILKTRLNEAVDRLPPQAGVGPAVYQQAKKTYALWSELLPLMTRGGAREMATAGAGTASTLGEIGLMTGHPGAMIPAIGKQFMKAAAPEGAANLLVGGNIGQAVKSFGQTLPRATAQVASSQSQPQSKEQIVQDFVMQQSNPAYAKALKDRKL